MKFSRAAIAFFSLFLLYGCTQNTEANNNAETSKSTNNTLNARQQPAENTLANNTAKAKEETTNESISENKNVEGNVPAGNKTIPANDSTADLQRFAYLEKNCFGFLTGNEFEFELVSSAGAAWVRPHPGPFAWGFIEKKEGEFDFGETDAFVLAAQQNNVLLLATIWPFAEWDQASDANCKVSEEDIFYPREKMEKEWKGDYFVQVETKSISGIPAYRCKPKNTEKYKEFLKKLVERYDGDGVEDMPGLVLPVRYYEVSNEPEMQSKELTFFKGNEADYVEVLKASNEAIKQACAECVVVQGGAAGSGDGTREFWGNVFKLGGASYFDAANTHFVKYGDANTLNAKEFKQIMSDNSVEKTLWITEAEFEYGTSDETVENSARGALSAGAKKIFFTSFNVGGHEGPKGQAAPVYKKITEKYCK